MRTRMVGGTRMFACGVATCAVTMMFALVGCSGQSPSISPSTSNAVTVSSSSGSTGQLTPTSQEGTVSIDLDYSAGTGYEWVFETVPEGVFELISQETRSLAAGDVSGGTMRDTFTFRTVGSGETTVTFGLVRPWEDGEPADEQVYAFTVGDAGIVLNPYKSNFDREPTISTS